MSDMQRVPVDSAETKTFTPPALLDHGAPVSFVLKTVTRRQREAMEYAMAEEGLTRFDDEAIRELTIDEVCRLWQVGSDHESVRRIKDYWSALDDYFDDVAARLLEIEAATDAGEEVPGQLPPFEHPDAEHYDDMMVRLTKTSEPIRRAGVANLRHRREFPRFTVAHTVTGWDGLDLKPDFDGGVLTIDNVVDLHEALVKKYDKELGEAVYAQLSMETLTRIYLNKAAEKNSKSPAQSQQTQAPTKTAGQASTNGKSPVSEPSDETLDA